LQDDTVKSTTDATSSQTLVEKRSKKKHEVNVSTLTVQAQETPIHGGKKKEKKKNKKPKPGNTNEDQEQADDTLQPKLNNEGEQDRNEKKKHKKRRHKKTSSPTSNSQTEDPNAEFSEGSSPKRQKIMAKSQVPVSQLIPPFNTLIEILAFLISNLFCLADSNSTIGDYSRRCVS
jgi:chemotaxis protein histidine kinase CheA